MNASHRIVIVGGGFGGLNCARSLRKAPARITLVDRRNFHLFQPLLYQVATGALSPANIAAPLRAVLRRQKNTEVLMADVVGFRIDKRQVLLAGAALEYDTLVMAAGSIFNYFGHPEWSALAPGLKTVEDATAIRRRVLAAFELAELEADAPARQKYLTFVIVGGGPTGVEMAGALSEVSRHTLRGNFRRIDPASARILLVEAGPRVLGTYPEDLSAKAAMYLTRLGVEVHTNSMVSDIQPDGVTVRVAGAENKIEAHTVLWTAGIKASECGRALAEATNAPTDRIGRIVVEPDLTIAGHPEIFVIGDLAHFAHQTGEPLAGVAPVAIQQGRYVAKCVLGRLSGKPVQKPFHYRDRGNMATIGRAAAVADLGWVRFGGALAWLTWLFVHLMYLVQFQNRVLVLVQWAWNYFTRNRSARLITGEATECEPPPDSGQRPTSTAVS